ncbi:MAG: hypothetical protein ACRDZ6_03410, partial [Acidimicrobiales bacterium]
MAVAATPAPEGRSLPWRHEHPLLALISQRVVIGVLTLFVVSIVIFLATQVLPGNAAYAILGHTSTPQRLKILEHQLGLNRGLFDQYGTWLGGLLSGHPGTSVANGESVWGQIAPRLVNSAVLVFITGIIGSVL